MGVGQKNVESQNLGLKSIYIENQNVFFINIYRKGFQIICSALNGAYYSY